MHASVLFQLLLQYNIQYLYARKLVAMYARVDCLNRESGVMALRCGNGAVPNTERLIRIVTGIMAWRAWAAMVGHAYPVLCAAANAGWPEKRGDMQVPFTGLPPPPRRSLSKYCVKKSVIKYKMGESRRTLILSLRHILGATSIENNGPARMTMAFTLPSNRQLFTFSYLYFESSIF